MNLRAFERFCSHLTVTSKEKGLTPLQLYGTQKYFFREVIKGVDDGIRFFYVLKARQQGITTIGLALDLYWLFTHPGIQGTFVVEEDRKLPNHRSTLEGFYKSLPKGLKVPVKTHNRNLFEFRNRSKLIYQAAGIKVKGQKSTFGQSTGVNFVHGTEMSSWADREAIANFLASLAETYEHRLYYFESTAKGFNDFHERWQDAKNAVTRGTIFIGWWRMEAYAVSRETLVFKMYGEDQPTGEERIWIDQVKFLYGYDITAEQLAWYRWKLAEDIHDEQLMFQYYPPTEEHAFILSGYRFFNLEQLVEDAKYTKNFQPTYYRYRFGPTYEQTEIYPCSERSAQLAVWKEADPRGFYVVAADPAFGSSYTADRYAIEVFRCWTNRIEQVAEYCTTEGNSYTFAWILAHLCGYYRNPMVPTTLVLEINGPGKAVMDEFFRLQQYPAYSGTKSTPDLQNVISGINNYLYTRSDQVGGSGYNYHWKTTQDLKEYVMNLYRDTHEAGKMIIKSPDLIEEMRYIQQHEGQIESATQAVHDDRVIATALAIEGWVKMLLPELYGAGVSWEADNLIASQSMVGSGTVLEYNLQNYLGQFRRTEDLQ